MTAKEVITCVRYGFVNNEDLKEYIIEALQKQIPKKPLPDNLREEGYCCCPVCKHLVDDVSNYCEHCGQRLEWGE